MIEIDIPGFGFVRLEYLVSDFTGTLSVDGKLFPEVKNKLDRIAKFLKVFIVTADTFGTVEKELADCNCEIHIITGENLDFQKEEIINKLGAEKVIAIGNGNNDRRMLKAAKIGICVCNDEGCSTDALLSSNIFVVSPLDALELLLNPKRLQAGLTF